MMQLITVEEPKCAVYQRLSTASAYCRGGATKMKEWSLAGRRPLAGTSKVVISRSLTGYYPAMTAYWLLTDH